MEDFCNGIGNNLESFELCQEYQSRKVSKYFVRETSTSYLDKKIAAFLMESAILCQTALKARKWHDQKGIKQLS